MAAERVRASAARRDHVTGRLMGAELAVAVFELDAVGTVVSLNAAAESLLGRPASKIVGSRLEAAIGRDFSESAAGSPDEFPTRRVVHLRRPDGSSVVLDLIAVPAREESEAAAVVVAIDVTERETEAESIHRYNERLLEVHAAAKLGGWNWDIASDTVEWSTEHYRIFGVDRADFVPTFARVMELFHEDDRDVVVASLQTAIETGQPLSYKGRIRRPDGEVRWIESVATSSVIEGVVVGWVGIVRDISDRESNLARLRESEARYKMMVDTANEAIWVVDANGDTTFANERLAELLGRPVRELLGASVFAFLDDEGQAAAAASFGLLRQGQRNRLDFRFIRADGSEVWTLISASPILDADGRYAGALAMLTDITERHRTEMELRDGQTRLAEAQLLARLGNWAVDRVDGTVTCSDEVFRLIGVEPDRGIASLESFMLLVHPDDRSRAEAFVRHVNSDAVPFSDELRIITPGGVERWLSLRVTPTFDDAGRVAAMHGTMQDISERKIKDQQLVHLALHDQLTGLPNRSLFNDRLHQALARRRHPVTVMLLDLDGFKAINDALGHVIGDALLVTVAKRISDELRPGDTVARFGGDEFTILLEGGGEEETRRTADRFLQAVSAPVDLEGRTVVAQASIGSAVADGNTQSADDLVRDADAAMYVAKRKGGHRHEAFSPSMHSAVVHRLALEGDLRSVELGAEMTLHYQPLVDLTDGHLAGFEALLRWNHPRRGMVSPVDFIPIAEEIGAIVPIGRWVVREACRQVSEWRRRYPDRRTLSMSVNVSARQLADPGIVADVARALDDSGLDPSRLTLEITETMIVADEEEACARLNELKALGVRISVDDFGTGYSSLGHLERFPIDELKIDRSFVNSLGGNTPDSGVALATIRLAQSLHLDIVAEGIEREEQLIELRRSACTVGQGFYFWKPMDAASAEALLDGGAISVLPEVPSVILVVDDEEALVRSTCRLLRGAGMEAIGARSGREALRIAQVTRLDAIILDVWMPDMDGFEVCRQLHELHGKVPVIYVSGSAVEVDDRVRGLNQGAEAYLTKPVAPTELLAVLGSLLRRSRSSFRG